MAGPAVNHRQQIEDWMAAALAVRGPTVGYLAQLTTIRQADQARLGWTLVVTMRHPDLSQGDLHVPTTVPALTVYQAAVDEICAAALRQLDDSHALIQRQIIAGTDGHGPG